jgi:hypothetical protein
MTVMADYLEDLAIDHCLRAVAHTPTAAVYLALFSTATTDAGGGTEANGGSYAPQAITFNAPSTGATTNGNVLTYTNMPAGTWTHCAVVDATSSWNMLFHGPLASSRTTTSGQELVIGTGEIDVSFTAGSNASDYYRNLIIDRFLRNQAFTPPATMYLATFTSATNRTTGGTESTGGSYARQAETFTAASSGVTDNNANVDFAGMPASTLTDLGVYDLVTSGNRYLWGTLNSSQVMAAGNTFRIATGDHTVTLA